MWKTKITFLLSRTFLSFLKHKHILFLVTYFFKILIKHLIASVFFLQRQILKNIDMSWQRAWHLPIAEANFEHCCLHGKLCSLKFHFSQIDQNEICTKVSFTSPEVMWTLVIKLPYTKVKIHTQVKSQTGLSSLQVSCKVLLELDPRSSTVWIRT